MSIHPTFMKTLNSRQPISTIDNANEHPVLRRKIISYPIPNVNVTQISKKEYQKLNEMKEEYDKKIEEFSIKQELREFEQKHFGKSKQQLPSSLPSLDKSIVQTLRSYSSPEENTVLDVPAIFPSNRSTSFRNRPASFSILDQPTVLSNKKTSSISCKPKPRPFVMHTALNDRLGIGKVSKDIVENDKSKCETFEEIVRFQHTCDNQIHEQTLRERIANDRQSRQDRRLTKKSFYASLGQEWALPTQEITERKFIIQEPPSPSTKEALDHLKKHDENLRVETIVKEKEYQSSVTSSTATLNFPFLPKISEIGD